MNRHLWQRIESLLAKYDQAILGTCGISEPHASRVACRMQEASMEVFIAHTSDHLFNLQSQPNCIVLSSEWTLHGRGDIIKGGDPAPPHDWQVVVRIQPVRLHILTPDGSGYAETIDFGESAMPANSSA